MRFLSHKKIIIGFLIILFALFCLISFGAAVGETTKLENPLKYDDPTTLIGGIIKAILGLVGSIALLMFIYGGFMWLTSGGNPETIKKGKETLVWAVIGLAVIFMSYALVHFILSALVS